jgi:mitogen-activated protein kinase 1/3
MTDPLIRRSPYQAGLYFVSPQPGTTLQSIGMTEWQVGSRYKLLRVLGYGSFSCVCLALDTATGEEVALKRIGDVLHSPDQAKRVLRELSILRRTCHPNLVGLRDCFIQPSSTGQCRMMNGKLVNCSIDLYIATEFASGGDLFHLRGQLNGNEIASLLWQLLQAVQYLHSLGVWHRDVKSQNAFLTVENGRKVVKLGDFGSARSAISPLNHLIHSSLGHRDRARHLAPHPVLLPTDSFSDLLSDRDIDGDTSRQGDPWQDPPMTRVVATPSYRAPEVIMSRGRYTDAMDMWGVGCIFGESLQRLAYVGSATTPNLAVAPLFAIRGMPKTPQDGETFGNPESLVTRRELEGLFDVIGTPSWGDAASVEMYVWRKYLERLPGKAPTLYRRFYASAGEVAVHLLTRLLDFDPHRRATCEEALRHEYFVTTEFSAMSLQSSTAAVKPCPDETAQERFNETELPGEALACLEEKLEEVVVDGVTLEPGSHAYSRLRTLLEVECQAAAEECAVRAAARIQAVATAAVFVEHKQQQQQQETITGGLSPAQHAQHGIVPEDYGVERLSNVADTWQQGRELDPRKFLGPKRHGEWSAQGGAETSRLSPGPRWGVSTLPPGLAEGHELDHRQVADIIRKQQER